MTSRRALLVGLSGPDGAGKTTAAASLGRSGSVVHLYGCFLCRPLRRRAGRLATTRGAGPWARSLSNLHLAVELAEHRLRLRAALASGGLVVADRTPLDTLVKLDPPPGSWPERALTGLLRRFDRVWLLDCDPAQLAARDREHSESELARLRERFARWGTVAPQIVTVDASGSPGRVVSALRAALPADRHGGSPAGVRPEGFMLALVGPDGAGKTTLAAAFARDYPTEVRVIYMGIWRPGFLRRLGAAASVVQLVYRPLKLWAYFLVAKREVSRGRLVVFERYVSDALLPPRPPLVALKKLYLRLIARSLPEPDLVLLLDLPGELMHARKGQHSPERLERSAAILRQHLAGRANVRVLDASRSAEEVKRQAFAAVDQRWRHASSRSTSRAISSAASARDSDAGTRSR